MTSCHSNNECTLMAFRQQESRIETTWLSRVSHDGRIGLAKELVKIGY